MVGVLPGVRSYCRTVKGGLHVLARNLKNQQLDKWVDLYRLRGGGGRGNLRLQLRLLSRSHFGSRLETLAQEERDITRKNAKDYSHWSPRSRKGARTPCRSSVARLHRYSSIVASLSYSRSPGEALSPAAPRARVGKTKGLRTETWSSLLDHCCLNRWLRCRPDNWAPSARYEEPTGRSGLGRKSEHTQV